VLSARFDRVFERQGTPRPWIPEPCALIGHPLWLLNVRRPVAQGSVCCPAPEPRTNGRVNTTQPALCIGRYAGTALVLGRRGSHQWCSAIAMKVATEPPYVCGAATLVGTWARKSRQDTRPFATCAGTTKAEKKRENPLSGVVCLLTTGDLIRVRLRRGLRALRSPWVSSPCLYKPSARRNR
jgi:hypothetical protein